MSIELKEEDRLFIGFEIGSGQKTTIPIFHTMITGQTQMSGKTTLLKYLAKAAALLDLAERLDEAVKPDESPDPADPDSL